ncbi:diacylglycerol/lipid kinase family protein [Arhodomonas aquaeolei]|uniref:diacylglycerol/lipid kinase family protein n=1 Tax=Arhodomonas aquaeolei TaxID=2369 RepID=UPI0003680A43|nr:diacylglycerol kinase family protein [Arhodomonas aquaeolei]
MPDAEPAAAAVALGGERLGLLLNPRAGGLRRPLERVRALAASLPLTAAHEADTPAGMAAALEAMAADGVTALVVVGGDGTVQAVLGQLLEARRFPRLPWLVVVPAGSTDMTARDIGLRGGPVAVLERLVSAVADARTLTARFRPVLGVGHGGHRVCGMFFGAGMIADGVGYFRERVRGRGLVGEKASALAVLRTLAAPFTRRPRGRGVILREPAALAPPVDHGLVLVSALDRLLFGSRPYWGGGAGALHCTVMPARPGRLVAALPRLLGGRPGHRLTPRRGFASGDVDAVTLDIDGDYVVDGELYPANSARGPVHVGVAERAMPFLVP